MRERPSLPGTRIFSACRTLAFAFALALALALLPAQAPADAPADAGAAWTFQATGVRDLDLDLGLGLCAQLRLAAPLDLSFNDLGRAAAALILKGGLKGGKSDAPGSFMPGDGRLPDTDDAGVKLTELFKSGDGKPAPVTVVSASNYFDAFLETVGLGRVAVRNMADVWGSADITTMQITAKSTADVHVFRVPLGNSAALIGLAGGRVFVEREADFCVTCPASWDAEAISVGGGLAVVLPGPGKSPMQVSVGGGPTLNWGPGLGNPSDPSLPSVSATVLGKLELVTF